MKILITGAEVEKNGDRYQVVYQGRIVYEDRLRTLCIVTAMNRARLDELLAQQPTVYKFRTR